MNKNAWKILGITAAVATVFPFVIKSNRETGEKTYDALLWHLSLRPKTDSGSDITLEILPNRFSRRKHDDIPEEELITDEDMQPACDIALTLEPKLDDDEPSVPVEPEI